MEELREKMLELLKSIEWSGPSDYSIGVSTCPSCRMRGGIRKQSDYYQGHSGECKLQKLIIYLEERSTRADQPVPRCCCKFNDDDEIVSLCMAHKIYFDERYKKQSDQPVSVGERLPKGGINVE